MPIKLKPPVRTLNTPHHLKKINKQKLALNEGRMPTLKIATYNANRAPEPIQSHLHMGDISFNEMYFQDDAAYMPADPIGGDQSDFKHT